MVTIQAYNQDRYGRTIADVTLKDGRNISRQLVKAAYAWWFFKYSDAEQLGILEFKAKIEKVGLWIDTNPVPSWIFRHRNELATFQPQQPSSNLTAPSQSLEPLPVRGNRRSKKYHRIDCPSYDLISPKNRVPFF